MNYFKNIEEFYKDFFKVYGKNLNNYFNKKKNIIKKIKQEFPFYSLNDIRFRLVRDEILNKDEYRKLMLVMFEQKKFNPKEFYNVLFMSKSMVTISAFTCKAIWSNNCACSEEPAAIGITMRSSENLVPISFNITVANRVKARIS